MKTIGERVRALRESKGFERQRDLANLVGVDQSVISDIERGAGFKAQVLMGLCEHLETTPEYVMLGDERNTLGEADLVSLYRNTSDEGRAAMLVMARSLKTSYPRVTTSTPQPRETTGTSRKVHIDTGDYKGDGFRGSGRVAAPAQPKGSKHGRVSSIANKPGSKGSGGGA